VRSDGIYPGQHAIGCSQPIPDLVCARGLKANRLNSQPQLGKRGEYRVEPRAGHRWLAVYWIAREDNRHPGRGQSHFANTPYREERSPYISWLDRLNALAQASRADRRTRHNDGTACRTGVEQRRVPAGFDCGGVVARPAHQLAEEPVQLRADAST
jgi:hypothetical protein